MVHLRDPAGGSVLEYLLDHNVVTTDEFPQGDGALTAPAASDSGWEADLHRIALTAPTLSKEVFDEHFAQLRSAETMGARGEIRAVQRGYAHLEGLSSLLYFAVRLC